MNDERERRRQNLVLAHAKVQGELLVLMMAIAGGYPELADDPRAYKRQLARDAQGVVDAAIALKRLVASDGDVGPGMGPE